jgi:hypothetical protein
MKLENIFIKELQREIIFHIGKNKKDNFQIIDNGKRIISQNPNNLKSEL